MMSTHSSRSRDRNRESWGDRPSSLYFFRVSGIAEAGASDTPQVLAEEEQCRDAGHLERARARVIAGEGSRATWPRERTGCLDRAHASRAGTAGVGEDQGQDGAR